MAGKVVRLKVGDVWMPPIRGNLVAQVGAGNAKLLRQEPGQSFGTAHNDVRAARTGFEVVGFPVHDNIVERLPAMPPGIAG